MDPKPTPVAICGGGQVIKEKSNNRVKLCGYLKKKRNKVGGWRKMWFVLQDKLLLSYASKEEYDNKLVSFKDVLNLVPGTQVRPLGGFRFTIETTSHVMYTFHCDDRGAYREWITMLLDSLVGNFKTAVAIRGNGGSFSNSVDNIPHSVWPNGVLNSPHQRELSSSCDSVHHCLDLTLSASSRPTQAPNAVRLPIARSTAKILERNGINSSDPPLKQYKKLSQRRLQEVEYCKRGDCSSSTSPNVFVRHQMESNVNGKSEVAEVGVQLNTEQDRVHQFRLHHHDGSSSGVNRRPPTVLAINSMFQKNIDKLIPSSDQVEILKNSKETSKGFEKKCDKDINQNGSVCSCCTEDGYLNNVGDYESIAPLRFFR